MLAQTSLQQSTPLAGPVYPWYAITVRQRYEKQVAAALTGKGYSPYVPARVVRKRWSDRIKLIEAPLFPGYVLCRLDIERRLPVLMTSGVTGFAGPGNVPAAIDEAEMRSVEALVQSGLHSSNCGFFAVGRRVRIDVGALTGCEGVLVRMKSGSRIVISLSLLQRSIAVDIDEAMVSVVHV